MKHLIESEITIREVIECLNDIKQNEIPNSSEWQSSSPQPNIKMIELAPSSFIKVTTSTILNKKIYLSLTLLGNGVGNNFASREVISVRVKANDYLGALINESVIVIYIPGKSKYKVYSWNNDRHRFEFKSSTNDRIIAIGNKTPFSILSESNINPPLIFFFNEKPPIDFLNVRSDMNSNNSKSPYFI